MTEMIRPSALGGVRHDRSSRMAGWRRRCCSGANRSSRRTCGSHRRERLPCFRSRPRRCRRTYRQSGSGAAEAAPEKPVELTSREEPEERLKPEAEAEVALPPLRQSLNLRSSTAPAGTHHRPRRRRKWRWQPAGGAGSGTLKPSDSTAIPTWRSRIAATLERNKRYPAEFAIAGSKGSPSWPSPWTGDAFASHIARGSAQPHWTRRPCGSWRGRNRSRRRRASG